MKKDISANGSHCLFTFSATSSALKAEKILKSLKAEFMMIPVPREISTSCGLAIKVQSDEFEKHYDYLIKNNVDIDSVYRVESNGKKKFITKIEKK